MRKEFVIAVVCLVMVLSLFGFVLADAQRDTNLYKNMVDASVRLIGSGSGVFIYDDVILTAAHVLKGKSVLSIELSDGTVLSSNDFYIDAKEDVGFVFVNADELHIAEVSPIPRKLGDVVFLVGTPHDEFFKFTLTKGILSHLDRDLPDMGWKDLLQTDAEGGYGSSGGPLYDSEGKVIGIYVGHAYNGGIGISLCEDAKSILEAYERCVSKRVSK